MLVSNDRLGFCPALAADAEYGEVVEVGLKFVLFLEGDAYGFEEAMVVDVEGRATVPTDDVMVPPVMGELVLVGTRCRGLFRREGAGA